MNDMWNRFARRVVITCGATKARLPQLRNELNRVGMTDYETYWSITPAYHDRLKRMLASYGNGEYSREPIALFNNALAHYYVVKSTIDMGLDNVLIMEDDVRWLKDLETLAAGVASLPEDYQVASFDVVKVKFDPCEHREDAVTGQRLRWGLYESTFSAACYALQGAGLRRALEVYDWVFSSWDRPKKNTEWVRSDWWFCRKYFSSSETAENRVTKAYAPVEFNLARQVNDLRMHTNTDYNRWSTNYYEGNRRAPRCNYGE